MISKLMARRQGGWKFIGVQVVVAAGAILAAHSLRADTLHLKNGNTIQTRVVRSDSKQVVCETGGNEFIIPRSLVDRIERSTTGSSVAASQVSSSHRNSRSLPLPLPATVPDIETGSQVIRNGAIDEPYLSQLDRIVLDNPSLENRHRFEQAYQQAAIFLTKNGNPEAAIAKYRHALDLDPDDLALTLALAYSLIKQNHYWQAVEVLSPAQDRHPNLPDIPLLLGSAYYGMEDLDRAILEWKQSLSLHDSPRLRSALERVEKERSVAGSYQELRSEHFILRYDEGQVRELANQVLATLENAFLDIESSLDEYPQEPIVVVLYPNQAFRDITRTPAWVGAINDGKIRIPVSGLTTMTPALARMLRHELTHSFVYRMTMGRCPVWFNEGLAQFEEGATTAAQGTELVRALNSLPPYSALEGSFMHLPPGRVDLVYAKSLAAIEFLRDTYNMGEVHRLLKAVASNPDFEVLLEDQLHMSYAQFDLAVANYVYKRYGS